jgi:hypothetical protein
MDEEERKLILDEEERKRILQDWLDYFGVKTPEEIDEIVGRNKPVDRLSGYKNWIQVRL